MEKIVSPETLVFNLNQTPGNYPKQDNLNTRSSCHILIKFEFSRYIFEKTQIPNFIKILPVGAELFHADIRRDGRTEGQA
jgi:hypothetical protein